VFGVLQHTGVLAAITSVGLPAIPASADPREESVGRIMSRVRPSRFPSRTFDITGFGARGDGVTDCTAAITEAIRRCNRAGGGHVLVPPGAFLTGAIHLRSNVDLHVAAGATLKFSQDPAAYLPAVFTRWQGMTGGVRNVFAQNLRMSSPNLNNVLRLKTNSLRGGFIENVHMRQVEVGQVAQIAVLIDFFYEDGPGHGFNPTIGGIHVSDLTTGQAKQPWYLVGYPDDHIGAVSLTNCTFTTTAQDIDSLT
jgi:hypothetical protein